MRSDRILLAHGSGGTMMKELVEELFVAEFGDDVLRRMDDAAALPFPGSRLAFSTDTYVVHPLFFPGGDIGRLAICGTVNDVATSGATPLYVSVGFVLEEGMPVEELKRIIVSMHDAAAEAGVRIVTGDTKVVERGKGDGVFITTTGVGVVPPGRELSGSRARPGDAILVSGTLGDHGMAIMAGRESLGFESPIVSDTAALHGLIECMLNSGAAIRTLRDPTRGGLAATLNEIARQLGQPELTKQSEADRARSVIATTAHIPTDIRPLYPSRI